MSLALKKTLLLSNQSMYSWNSGALILTTRTKHIMTDSISNTGPVGPAYAKAVKARVEEPQSKATSAAGGDKIDFSAEAERLIAEPGFDATKVAAIKQAIASGNYPLDTKRIAENFVALEKMISHTAPSDPASGG